MIKVFLETSFFIRFFTKDDEQKFKDCLKLLELVESGKFRPYISNVVIQEVLFVLTKLYKFSKFQVLKDLDHILSIRNLVLIEQTNTKKALMFFKKFTIKYGDCLIATQVPKDCRLVTYDADFKKIEFLKIFDFSALN